ncbi:MAG: YHS domain-containing (seleno)protein [Caulobacteraceae bacterium]
MPTRLATPSRRNLPALGLGAALLVLPSFGVTAPALAFDASSRAAVNVDASGLALRGYDPVAYFTAGKPIPGDPRFTATHAGATYRFSSAANRDAFLANPAKFAPAYGGFCAYGASVDHKADGDPQIWKIVDGRLYVNVSPRAADNWRQDIPGNIRKADANWSQIKDKSPNDL